MSQTPGLEGCSALRSPCCALGDAMAGDFCAHVHDCTEKQLLAGPRGGKAHPLTLFSLCKEPVTDWILLPINSAVKNSFP